MSPDLALFLFGVLITLILLMGLLPFFLMASIEQAQRDGSALPGLVRWLTPICGLDSGDEVPAAVRSEPKP
jgi:hypothetical protein